MTRRIAFTTACLAAGFSGLAVLATILGNVALLVAELLAAFGASVLLLVLIKRTPRPIVVSIARVAITGALAGIVATGVYDVTRTVLSLLDPSPYSPFEALRRFGLGVLPIGSASEAVFVAGFAVHLLNGASFGVMYAMLAQGRVKRMRIAAASGVAWGLILELIQSILYPGWLGITTVIKEFLVISGLGHVAYGATLGLAFRRLEPRHPEEELE